METTLQRDYEIHQEIRAIAEKLQEAVREYKLTIEAVDERIDRGNKQWRRIRAAQQLEAERAGEEGWGELPEGDATGGPSEGLRALSDGVGDDPGVQEWEAKKRAIDRHLAGLD